MEIEQLVENVNEVGLDLVDLDTYDIQSVINRGQMDLIRAVNIKGFDLVDVEICDMCNGMGSMENPRYEEQYGYAESLVPCDYCGTLGWVLRQPGTWYDAYIGSN